MANDGRYHNQIGVYDVKLNISQIQIIHEALQNVKYQKHLKKHWKDMYQEVIVRLYLEG